MVISSEGKESLSKAGLGRMGSYTVLTLLLVALIVLGVYPTILMSILESVATSI
jgi:hypothetical protein